MKTNTYSAILGNTIGNPDMGALTAQRPLATLPFDGKYRLLDFQLSALAHAGIRNVFGIFQQKNVQSVFDHVRSGREWGLSTLLSRWFLGFYDTDLASKTTDYNYYDQLITYLKRSGTDRTVYLGCEILCNIDLGHIIDVSERTHSDITVVYKRLARKDISEANDVLEVSDNDEVISHGPLSEQAGKSNCSDSASQTFNMSADIYVIKTDLLIEKMEEERKSDKPRKLRYLLRDLVIGPKALAYEYTGYISNIHSVKAYYEANMDMLNPQYFYSLLYSNQKVYTKVKNEESTYFAPTSRIEDSQFASGSIIKGEVIHSIVSRNCRVEEGSKISDSIIFPQAMIGADSHIEYAIVDKNVDIAPGVTIRGTEDNPLVIAKGTKVTEDIIQ